jgi:acyl transferase domain-containing protein
MLATSLTPKDAEQYCASPEYSGRLVVAAYNSPTSVTLSGDSDAIDEAVANLQSKDIFVRRLQVDTAYHSPHMRPCVDPYLESMQQLGMTRKNPGPDAPAWLSSAIEGKRIDSPDQLKPSYWIDNLVSPVRFSTAISTAVEEMGMPDMFLEIGPHTSLDQPIRQNLDSAASADVFYAGMLKRHTDAITSISDALGSIWCQFGREAVKFTEFDKVLSGGSQASPSLLTDLPAYPWQHDKEYWYENRFLRRRYQSTIPPTELLGEEWEIGASHEAKWRTFLNPREIPWLLQHQLNDVAVLPGAAYVVMAATAARRIFHNQTLRMIEIRNLRFEVPVIFPDEHTSIETILTVVNISQSQTYAEADFFIDYCSQPRNDE